MALAQRAQEAFSEDQMSRAALQAFFGIAKDWKLTNEQQRVLLGSPAESTFFKWKKNKEGRLSLDTLDRVSYVMGIHKALRILFGDIKSVQRWIHASNDAPLFGGRSAIDVMTGAGHLEDLARVRRYLDAERGW
jgi:hypothetical protein